MSWNHIVCEGFCFGENKDKKYPCGQNYPTIKCLGGAEHKICPYLDWAESDIRKAAEFVPFYVILWDKIKMWSSNIWDTIMRWTWDSLWFNRRKTDEFFKKIRSYPIEDICPEDMKIVEERFKVTDIEDFNKWFEKQEH